MNKAKLGRHLGIGRNYHGEFPQIVHNIPLGHLAGAEVRGIGGVSQNTPGQIATVFIDPPVGGFVAADLLAIFPREGNDELVNAVHAWAYDQLFAPGHWKLRQQARPPAQLGKGYWSALYCVQRNAAGALATKAPGGSAAPPTWYFRCASTTADSVFSYESEFYVAEPWFVALLSYATLADADSGTFHLEAEPVHLLDDNSGTR